jgi:hypothetical protein
MAIVLSDVRFREQSGHQSDVAECPLLTQSGHCRPQPEEEDNVTRLSRASGFAV